MEQIELRAMGKINLGLDVVRRREDGYHDVRMIMQTVRLYDRITIEKALGPGISLSSNLHFLPTGETNLGYRAAERLLARHPDKGGVNIALNKRIPVAAGMAGGSSDAAAVLYGVNRLLGLGESMESLREIGAGIGADVPYCLMRGTMLAEGIGDRLTRLPPCPECLVPLAKPPVSVSTKYVYESLKLDETTVHPDIDGMLAANAAGDLKGMCALMGNVLEEVTIPAYPVIGELIELMKEYGALNALMSGSGPTVFGIFDDNDKMMEAKRRIRESGKAVMVYATGLYQVRAGG